MRSLRHGQRDPLYRGDARTAVRLPSPAAAPDVVAHILALAGHDTPFLSASESRAAAAHFAARGRIWTTTGLRAEQLAVRHLSRAALLRLLSQRQGPWTSHSQRLQAYAYVKRHAEHLLDFSPHAHQDPGRLRKLVDDLFDRD